MRILLTQSRPKYQVVFKSRWMILRKMLVKMNKSLPLLLSLSISNLAARVHHKDRKKPEGGL